MCICGWRIYGERNETETEERETEKEVWGEKDDRQIYFRLKKDFPKIFIFDVYLKSLEAVIFHFQSKEIIVQKN